MRNKICFGKNRVKYMIGSIIEEIHKIREEYAEKFDYDVDAMFDDLRQKQSQSDHKIMSFAVDKEKRISEEKKVG